MQSLVETNRWKWSKRARLVMARDAHRCQLRLPPCTITATEVDHILPRSVGGTDDLDNLRAVCHRCHVARGMVDTPRREPRRYSITITRDYTRRPGDGAG